MDTGFQKVARESTKIVETGSKTREEKICGLHEIENYGFCQLELFTTSNSMALTQQKLFVRRSLVSSRMEILAFRQLLLPFPVLSNMFSILIGLCKFFHTRNMEK